LGFARVDNTRRNLRGLARELGTSFEQIVILESEPGYSPPIRRNKARSGIPLRSFAAPNPKKHGLAWVLFPLNPNKKGRFLGARSIEP
jgi:hypothetical protein